MIDGTKDLAYLYAWTSNHSWHGVGPENFLVDDDYRILLPPDVPPVFVLEPEDVDEPSDFVVESFVSDAFFKEAAYLSKLILKKSVKLDENYSLQKHVINS